MNEEQLDWVYLLEEEDQKEEYDKGGLIARRIKCPDGTILHSFNGNYVDHTQEDGQYFALGHNGYISRVIGDCSILEDCNIYETDTIDEIREVFYWGTNGKNLDQPTTFILLKDLSNPHISNILKMVQGIGSSRSVDLFTRELHYRKRTQIYIGEYEYE